MPASNGNDESPTTNTTTHTVLLSLLSLTGLEVKSLWGCYFSRSGNGAGMKTMEWRETFSPDYRKDPTLLCWHDRQQRLVIKIGQSLLVRNAHAPIFR
jgi:hypothetical protein